MMTITHGTVELAGLKNSERTVLILAALKYRSTQTLEEGVRKGHKVDIVAESASEGICVKYC